MQRASRRCKERAISLNQKQKRQRKNDTLTVEACTICMDEIECRGVLSVCDHWFCFQCIHEWSKNTNTCPLCKLRFRCITKISLNGNGSPKRTVRIKDKNQPTTTIAADDYEVAMGLLEESESESSPDENPNDITFLPIPLSSQSSRRRSRPCRTTSRRRRAVTQTNSASIFSLDEDNLRSTRRFDSSSSTQGSSIGQRTRSSRQRSQRSSRIHGSDTTSNNASVLTINSPTTIPSQVENESERNVNSQASTVPFAWADDDFHSPVEEGKGSASQSSTAINNSQSQNVWINMSFKRSTPCRTTTTKTIPTPIFSPSALSSSSLDTFCISPSSPAVVRRRKSRTRKCYIPSDEESELNSSINSSSFVSDTNNKHLNLSNNSAVLKRHVRKCSPARRSFSVSENSRNFSASSSLRKSVCSYLSENNENDRSLVNKNRKSLQSNNEKLENNNINTGLPTPNSKICETRTPFVQISNLSNQTNVSLRTPDRLNDSSVFEESPCMLSQNSPDFLKKIKFGESPRNNEVEQVSKELISPTPERPKYTFRKFKSSTLSVR